MIVAGIETVRLLRKAPVKLSPCWTDFVPSARRDLVAFAGEYTGIVLQGEVCAGNPLFFLYLHPAQAFIAHPGDPEIIISDHTFAEFFKCSGVSGKGHLAIYILAGDIEFFFQHPFLMREDRPPARSGDIIPGADRGDQNAKGRDCPEEADQRQGDIDQDARPT